MSTELIRYQEPLTRDELSFLLKKEGKERRLFYKVVRIFMILCFICPFVIAWFKALEGTEDPFSLTDYFIGVLALMVFSGIGIYLSYYYNLRRVQNDIRFGTKTVERAHVLRKQYMHQTNGYYLYIDSPNKLSIEVKEDDYHSLESGDEVNIEYTTFAKLYLGYF